MNARHRRTLAAIFALPTPASLNYDDAMELLRALGATVDDRREGSRVAFRLRDRVGSLHRPHPSKELKRYQVRDLRDLLERAGITPDTEE